MMNFAWYLELDQKRSFGYYTSRINPKLADLTQNGLNMTISAGYLELTQKRRFFHYTSLNLAWSATQWKQI